MPKPKSTLTVYFVVGNQNSTSDRFFYQKYPDFYDEKNEHQVILRNYATATSGVNQISKNQRYYLRINTKKSVKTQTFIDIKIKLM